jgi:glycine/D-amino acid oxidase-like deaminating enzyme
MNGTNGSAKHYDMVVIGSGAAGHHGAVQAAKLGKKVAVVEQSTAVGGASINTGTIPSKTLREGVLRSNPIRVCGSPGSRSQTWRRESRKSRPTEFECLRVSFAAMISMYCFRRFRSLAKLP